jgi:tryptophan halogenase
VHYSATAREESPFWQWCRTITLPDSLQERIELFRGSGALPEGIDELFRASSWQSVFEGMGVRPSVYSRRVESMGYAEIAAALTTAKAAIAGMVAHLPTHEEYLRAPAG